MSKRTAFLLSFLAGILVTVALGASRAPAEHFQYVRVAFAPDVCPVSGTVRVIWFEQMDQYGGHAIQWGQFQASEVCTFSVLAQTEKSKIPSALIMQHDSLPLGEIPDRREPAEIRIGQ